MPSSLSLVMPLDCEYISLIFSFLSIVFCAILAKMVLPLLSGLLWEKEPVFLRSSFNWRSLWRVCWYLGLIKLPNGLVRCVSLNVDRALCLSYPERYIVLCSGEKFPLFSFGLTGSIGIGPVPPIYLSRCFP